jgi:hypothetical protein
MLVQINISDIDGLVALLKDIVAGKITGSAEIVAQFQSKCPGIFKFLISIVAKIKLTLTAIFDSLTPPQQELLIKVGEFINLIIFLYHFFQLKVQIVESFTKIKVKLDEILQKLLDALKKAIPELEVIINIKIDVKGTITALIDVIMAKIPTPSELQKVIDSLPPADPAKLDSLIVKIKGIPK